MNAIITKIFDEVKYFIKNMRDAKYHVRNA